MEGHLSLYTGGQKGFTLIELLVVIAIIGILASIVLVSLGNSRTNSLDSNIKGNLDSIRTQAEIYANDHDNSYGTFGLSFPAGSSSTCLSDTGNHLFSDPTIKAAMTGAQSSGGGSMRCLSTGNAWAVSVALKSNAGLSWCVSSCGIAKQINTTNALVGANTCLPVSC